MITCTYLATVLVGISFYMLMNVTGGWWMIPSVIGVVCYAIAVCKYDELKHRISELENKYEKGTMLNYEKDNRDIYRYSDGAYNQRLRIHFGNW